MKNTENRTETVNLRVSTKLKDALRLASAREHRSMANMVEFLVFNYCEQNGLVVTDKSITTE